MLGISKYTTPLKGLYIGGHWAEMGGGVPIAVKAAFNTALLVLKERKHNYFKVYSNYFDNL
jgi:prolycopene isomerase